MKKEIKSYPLDQNYIFVHKEGLADTNFGLDNSYDLFDGGFGLYSSANVKAQLGPLKSEFFRIAICLEGSVSVDCGLETFRHHRNTIHLNFPSQVFSLYDKSDDMHAYYILFSEQFIEDILPMKQITQQFPFLDYGGVPFIELSETERTEIESLFLKIDQELKLRQPSLKQSIQLYINLILITTNRSYQRQNLSVNIERQKDGALVTRFKKMVSQFFIQKRNVADYAKLLNVTPNYLNKAIKEQTSRTASSFIEQMLLIEAKALLRYTDQSVSEIAYHLEFTDPSHFNKFFKKETSLTPLQYRIGG